MVPMIDEEEYYLGASIDNLADKEDEFKKNDPFNKNWDFIKNLNNLDQNFKRRVARTIGKAVDPNTAYLDSANAVQSGTDNTKSKAINPGTAVRNGYGLFDVITPPYNLYELANFYDTSFANHAAIDAKVENVVGLGYDFVVSSRTMLKLENVEDENSLGRARKRIERAKIEMRDWLENLNDDDSFTKIMEKIYVDVQATGNGYMEIGRKVTGEIGYIGHIPSTTMRVRRLNDGYVQIIQPSVTYFRNFGAKNQNPVTTDTRPNEVIHFKQYSPLNTYYGVPDIISALSSLIGDQLASNYNIDYFENKAVPRYIITLKGAKLSADAEDKMFRFLQTGLKGQSHRTLYIPLPGDTENSKVEFDMKPIENGVQEGSFKEYRLQNRNDILVAHQVPLSKLGGGDSGSIANALAQDRTFKEQVSRPAQNEISKLISKIVREKTDILELKFNELTLTDEIAQSQILERYVKTQVMMPNEAREKLGLPQIKDGDIPFEMSPRQETDARANLAGNRERDSQRANNNSDSPSTISGRNAQGEGRSSN
jgi:PBSX family phage portal protein